ncbi:translationally-controlled tumor protein homolog [Xenia sp. Carnegie-2017]|uniref:translationally-controlled tumor protein homolog n=1 Tax=Xenia sp. Carnegie-2017 TaxID=2897299 RepID=UPI001F049A16|nr:translationally-controlled tumor protein homolog [Xenia sp. Carnegie-2017]
MIIYKDRISGDELFSDSFPMKLIDDLYYEVEGKTVAESSGGIDDSLIGGNKSAEEPSAEEYNAETTYGCNIVFNHRLSAAPVISKKDYSAVIKPYVKKIYDSLIAEGKTEDAAVFKSGMGEVVKKIKGMWDDLVPYTGESLNQDAMMCFMNYRENGDPYMIFFKHGLVEEKC